MIAIVKVAGTTPCAVAFARGCIEYFWIHPADGTRSVPAIFFIELLAERAAGTE
jgi:hypothetical protein